MSDGALEHARAVLDQQPFSALVGARITAFGGGRATLELDVREELLQQHGFVHGGVVSYAADNALTFAAGSATDRMVLTSGFSIEYLRPAQGQVLRAEATVVRAGRSRIVVRCDVSVVRDGVTVLCAVAQGDVAVAD